LTEAGGLDLARLAAGPLLDYPYKLWGFGEEIGLTALRKLSATTGEDRYAEFTRSLADGWCARFSEPAFRDHVAPGALLVELHESGQGDGYVACAERLARLYGTFPVVGGLPVHRPDLEPWAGHLWVDCLSIDAPFLLRLWRANREPRWLHCAEQHAGGYLAVLQDPGSALFWHGFDARAGRPDGCLWGRGNGWALLGLVATADLLRPDSTLRTALEDGLRRQITALTALQDPSGHWRTVLDDPAAPLETSVAAFVVIGALEASRRGILDEGYWKWSGLRRVLQRARTALVEAIDSDGVVAGVSEATPIGDLDNYRRRASGAFPWGQGPAVLALLAWERGRDGGLVP
jgi:unsaturated rhamnogalacturonyl hydrolase